MREFALPFAIAFSIGLALMFTARYFEPQLAAYNRQQEELREIERRHRNKDLIIDCVNAGKTPYLFEDGFLKICGP